MENARKPIVRPVRLSILIPTMESRRKQFGALMIDLERQRKDIPTGLVEILHYCDQGVKHGGKEIGQKSQELLERAKGDYVVRIDDDDTVHPQYLKRILTAASSNPDCIGFKIACYGYDKRRPNRMEPACVSNRYDTWRENVNGFRYVRCPHHLVPVRREHALKVGFTNTSWGEDSSYSFGLRDRGLLKSEVFIDEFMYTIRHDPHK